MSNDNATPRTWNDYFIQLAQSVSVKSKDPRSQVGAVLVDEGGLVISTGFNGMARLLEDDSKVLGERDEKLKWIMHAEHNAILNAARCGAKTLGCTIYVNKFPCFACLQMLVQAGINRVCTNDHEYWQNDPSDTKAHDGKKYVIRLTRLEVDAPNHPDYQRKPPTLRPPAKTKPSNQTVTTKHASKQDATATIRVASAGLVRRRR